MRHLNALNPDNIRVKPGYISGKGWRSIPHYCFPAIVGEGVFIPFSELLQIEARDGRRLTGPDLPAEYTLAQLGEIRSFCGQEIIRLHGEEHDVADQVLILLEVQRCIDEIEEFEELLSNPDRPEMRDLIKELSKLTGIDLGSIYRDVAKRLL